jgi:hypothetical protein
MKDEDIDKMAVEVFKKTQFKFSKNLLKAMDLWARVCSKRLEQIYSKSKIK